MNIIYYEKTKIKNMITIHVPIHYPGEFPEPDHADAKQKLAVLKRAKYRIDEQVKQLKLQVEQEEIRSSGQLDLEEEIKNDK